MTRVDSLSALLGCGRKLVFALGAGTLGLCIQSPAAAEDPAPSQDDPAVTATARVLAVDGVKLAQTDRCAEAIDKLEQAERLHHSPIVQTRLGECYIKLGRLLAGVESLRAVLREPLPAAPSEALTQAYDDARSLLDTTKPKLASLTVRVEGVADPSQLSLTIDGKSLPAALVGAAQPSDPGEHQVQVSAPGYLTASRRVTLGQGDAQTVVLTPVASPHAAEEQRARANEGSATELGADAVQPETEVKSTAAPDEALSASHIPAYVTWGVSAAALGVGVAFGVIAMGEKSDLDQRCPDKACPPDAKGLLDDSRRHATISTIGYAAGLAGAAIGGVLFWLESRSTDRAASTAGLHAAPNGVALRF